VTDTQADCWTLATLDQLAHVGAGNPAPQDKKLFEDGKYPFIRTSDVGQIRFGEIGTAADLLNEQGAAKLRLVPKGTVLMPKSGASTFLNHRVLTTADAFVSSHLATITPKDGITDPRYLLYALSQVAAQDLLPENSYPSLNLNLIKTIKIPLPPLEEQQRIVAILDEAFEGLARARAHAEANLHNAKELVATSTDALCSEATDDWTVGKMGDFCTFEGGFAFKSGDAVKKSQVQLIRIGNLYQNILDLERKPVFYPDDFAESYSKFRLNAGDIILSLTGTVGKQDYGFAVAVPETDRALLLNQRVARIMPKNDEILSPNFLLRFLRSGSFLATLYNISRGTRQANLSTKDMAELPMAVPPMSKQLEIVESLDSIDASSVQLVAAYESSIVDLDRLRQSLLQKAFAGELSRAKAA
jgi:type I restriction enzyme S subunit